MQMPGFLVLITRLRHSVKLYTLLRANWEPATRDTQPNRNYTVEN